MQLKKLTRPGIFSYAAQRTILKSPLRGWIASFLAKGRPRFSAAPDPKVSAAVSDLNTHGIYLMHNYLDSDRIEKIKQAVASLPLDERFSPQRKNLDLDDMPADVHVAEYRTSALLQFDTIMEIANDPFLLQTAAQYLGCKPTISNMSVWWSFPTGGEAQEAENYHRDVDDWRFLKFFLYLTDVDSDSGPHRFVKNSHRSNRLTNLKRITDEEVSANFPQEDQLEMTGKAGDAFMELTFGLHKGQPPRKHRRLLLQVEYSINPVAVYDYSPLKLENFPYDPYVNRLYVSPK